MQVTEDQTTAQEATLLLPDFFPGEDGLFYRRARANPKKYFVYKNEQDATHAEAHCPYPV